MTLKNLMISCSLVFVPVFSTIADDELKDCAARKDEIQKEIYYAQIHGNHHRLEGFEKTLAEIDSECTAEGLQSRQHNVVKEKERKVAERTRALIEAHETGQADRINNQMKKLEEARQELAEARAGV